MKRQKLLFFFSLIACAIPAAASAQSLGLNFAATDPDAATSSLGAADVAGVVPQANWNNLEGNAGAAAAGLVLSDGSASGVSVEWSSPNTWRSGGNNAFPAGPDHVLTSGYLDSNQDPGGGPLITVNNIDSVLRAPAYSVYVYFVSDSGANRGGGYTIDDGNGPVVQYGSTMESPSSFILDPGTDIDNSLDGTYLLFRQLTGSSFTLTSDASLTNDPATGYEGFRAPINAIQIVGVPEPATALLVLAAAVAGGLACRRRKM